MAYIQKGAPTETLEQYLARGGKVTTCKPEQAKRKRSYNETPDDDVVVEEESEATEVNMDLVPDGLKIALGITET